MLPHFITTFISTFITVLISSAKFLKPFDSSPERLFFCMTQKHLWNRMPFTKFPSRVRYESWCFTETISCFISKIPLTSYPTRELFKIFSGFWFIYISPGTVLRAASSKSFENQSTTSKTAHLHYSYVYFFFNWLTVTINTKFGRIGSFGVTDNF